jgi:hypothetical protein
MCHTILLSPTFTIALGCFWLFTIALSKLWEDAFLVVQLGHVFREFVRLRRELFSCTVALIAGLSEERL